MFLIVLSQIWIKLQSLICFLPNYLNNNKKGFKSCLRTEANSWFASRILPNGNVKEEGDKVEPSLEKASS